MQHFKCTLLIFPNSQILLAFYPVIVPKLLSMHASCLKWEWTVFTWKQCWNKVNKGKVLLSYYGHRIEQ